MTNTCQILPTANIVEMGKIHLACCFAGREVSGLYNYANTLWFLFEKFLSVFEPWQELSDVKGCTTFIKKTQDKGI